MNPQKFLFVTWVTDEELYSRCLDHLNKNLEVPEGFTVDFLGIRNANSIAEAYNQALSNDARFKIYLHEDTFLIHRFFLQDILDLFRYNPSLGMIGMAGCKKLPESGKWWDGIHTVGKVITALPDQTFTVLNIRDMENHFETVEGIDGMLLATQFDIPWQEEVTDKLLYASFQALEFIKRGYLVGVPQQIEPWCIHCYNNEKPSPGKYTHLQLKFLPHLLPKDESEEKPDLPCNESSTANNDATVNV